MKIEKVTIEVKVPDISKECKYSDILVYLVKVVSQFDVKFEFLVGLASYALTRGLSEKQKQVADDLIDYYAEQGFFKKGQDNAV